MKKKTRKPQSHDELRREYDMSTLKDGVRGKYVERYRAGTNLVLLSPDVAEHFHDDQSANKALRTLIHVRKPAPTQSLKRLKQTRVSVKTDPLQVWMAERVRELVQRASFP